MMNRLLLVAFMLAAQHSYSQCPFPVSLDSTGNCIGSVLSVKSKNNIARIVWYNGSTLVKTVLATIGADTGTVVAGGNGGGSAANQLNFPQGIFLDAAGNLYVVDANNSRVQKFAPGSTNGVTVAGGYGFGSAANQLDGPVGVWVNSAGDVYVADYGNFRIQKWTPGASSGITVAGGNGGGPAANQFDFPVGIWLDDAGNIYVADNNNHRVQKWAPGATTGVTVAGGNGAGSAANQLNFPEDVFVDPGGNLYVLDEANFRVQKWAPGATSGITVAGGNGNGSAANQLSYPYGLFVDGAGNVYIGDADNDRVQKWVPGATSGVTVAGGNGGGAASNQLLDPRFVSVDASGNVYVAEDENGRVTKWGQSPVIDTSFTTTATGTYTAVVTDTNGCTVTTNAVKIVAAAAPAVTITSSTTTVTSCSAVTFNAKTVNGGVTPIFQWQVNGIDKGFNNSSFTNNNWHSGDQVTCILTSNSTCATVPTTTSNSITIKVTGTSSLHLQSRGGTCLGDTLFVNNQDSLSRITWYNDNTPVDSAQSLKTLAGATVAGGNGVGYASNQLNTPMGIYVDKTNNVYVADEKNSRVQKWAPGATSGITVAASSSIVDPFGVFVDAGGYLYVSDIALQSVVRFPPGSTSSTTGVTVAGGNGTGVGPTQLNIPRGIFVDAAGYLYVIDVMNERVQKFPPGSTGTTPGVTVASNLGAPVGIFLDTAGNLYVSDAGYERVQKWLPGATSGITVAGGNGTGSAANQLDAPGGIYVDREGNVFVADEVNSRVQKWAPGATSGVTVAGGNGEGLAADQVSFPGGLYLDAAGNIYVTDYDKNSVQKWVQFPIIDTTYKPATSGIYHAIVTNNSGCIFSTDSVNVNPIVTPSVTIVSSIVSGCLGTPITFTAKPFNGGTPPAYQWQVNGNNVNNNTSVYTTDTLSTGAVISCIITSNAPCVTQPKDTSNKIKVVFGPSVTPAVSIAASATVICRGTLVTFIATAVNCGTSPIYQWGVNGNNAGINSTSFTSGNLNDGDAVTCVVTTNEACTTSSLAQSNVISIHLNTAPPAVSIYPVNPIICEGATVTFTAAIAGATGAESYQWQLNGNNAGTNSPVFAADSFVNGDSIQCIVKSDSACATAFSNKTGITVNPVPSVASATVYVMLGQSITLSPVVTGNLVKYVWSPATWLSSTTIENPVATPLQDIMYTLSASTAAGCTASGSITVKQYSTIAVPNAFTPNGDGINDIFYVLGNEPGAMVKDFTVYNRWGQPVFEKKNIAPGDSSKGWDGNYLGLPAPVGVYVYYVTVVSGNGAQNIFKGIVTLLR